MARQVFFSFHYDDVLAVNVVRHSDTIRGRYSASSRAFFDKSLWEETKKQGEVAIKKMINGALDGSSVTCVLIGQQTWERPWVRYELLKSFERGNGIFGIHIYNTGPENALAQTLTVLPMESSTKTLAGLLADPAPRPAPVEQSWWDKPLYEVLDDALTSLFSEPPKPGQNPLDYLSVATDWKGERVALREWGFLGWWPHTAFDPLPIKTVRYPLKSGSTNFSELFPTYDWKLDNGYQNLGQWIEKAAGHAGR